MPYYEDPDLAGYWFYDGLRIQADVESHQLAVEFARTSLPPGASVLDIGAGEGALSKQFQDAGFTPSCTTWNDKVRLEIPKYRLDLDRPFSSEDVGGHTFGLVCAIEIIEHVENPAALLRSCAGVLAPGGWLIVSTPNVECAPARLQWAFHGSPRIFDQAQVRDNRHISMAWRHGLEFLVETAGLTIVEKHLVGRPRLHPGLGAVAKRLVYRLMEATLSGDIRGTTRLYVLRRAEGGNRAHGPEDVY